MNSKSYAVSGLIMVLALIVIVSVFELIIVTGTNEHLERELLNLPKYASEVPPDLRNVQ
jgi:hypothetical protein